MICTSNLNLDRQFNEDTILDERIELTKLGKNPTPIAKWLASIYRFSSEDYVLEVGCGNGHSLPDLMQSFPPLAKLICTDNSMGMLEAAKKRMQHEKRIQFELADVNQLTYDNSIFDVVLSHYMFYLLPDKAKAMQEILRVLKPSGWLGMLVFGKQARKVLFEMAHAIDPNIPVEGKCADSFHHEIAHTFLNQYFLDIKVLKFSDELQVIEPDLTVNFMIHHPFIMQNKVRPDFSEKFKELLQQKIDINGTFEINADSYLFICRN